MNDKYVYVVTNPELGWDCVVAVYDANEVQVGELEAEYHEDDGYVIHHKLLLTRVERD